MVSFRLGGEDGVAVEAAKWAGALGLLGWTVRTVAGAGPVDAVLPGLAMDAPEPPTRAEVDGAIADADLVIVENLCSLPLNPASGGRGGGGLRRASDAAASPRPAVAAPAPGPPPAATGRRRLGARDHQRAEPRRAGGPRDRGHDDLQRLRPGSAAGRAGRRAQPPSASPMARPCCCNRRARWRARTSGEPSPSPRRSTPPTGSSVRPRTGTGPNSSAWSRRPAAPSSSARPRAAAPSPTPTRRATPSRSPRSGRASATRRWSRRPTGGRWPSARTRWRPSWRLRLPLVRRRRPGALGRVGWTDRTRASSRTTSEVAAEHFNLADLPAPLVGGAAARSRSLTVR